MSQFENECRKMSNAELNAHLNNSGGPSMTPELGTLFDRAVCNEGETREVFGKPEGARREPREGEGITDVLIEYHSAQLAKYDNQSNVSY